MIIIRCDWTDIRYFRWEINIYFDTVVEVTAAEFSTMTKRMDVICRLSQDDHYTCMFMMDLWTFEGLLLGCEHYKLGSCRCMTGLHTNFGKLKGLYDPPPPSRAIR